MFTGVLAQVDEMLDREERERCCHALKKELKAIEDDIRFEFHKSSTELYILVHSCMTAVFVIFILTFLTY